MKLKDYSLQDFDRAFAMALARSPFATTLHQLFRVVSPAWYNGPEDAKRVAHELYSSVVASDSMHKGLNTDEFSVSSGYLILTFSANGDYLEITISFSFDAGVGFSS